jgi:translation initiation factor 5A
MVDSEIWPDYGAYPPAGKTDSEFIVRVEPEDLETGGYAMIRSMPCKLTAVKQLPRGTRAMLFRHNWTWAGLDVFTGEKHEYTIRSNHDFTIEVPVTTNASFLLLDIDPSTGNLSLLSDSGETKEDASLNRVEDGSFDAVGAECLRRFDEGEVLRVTVLTIMGKEIVVEVTTDGGD